MLGLAYGGFFEYMQKVLPTQGTDVRVSEIKDTRNYLVEEQPEAVISELIEFFGYGAAIPADPRLPLHR